MEYQDKSKVIFNVAAFLETVKQDKKQVFLYLVFGSIIGIIVAFSIPKKYTSCVMLAPETATNNSLLSSVSSLASMVGLYNDANPTGDAIYPEIYPDLMGSTDFLIKMFDIKVVSKDSKINTTYYKYLTSYQKETWWSYPMMGLRNLMKKLKGDVEKPNGRKVDPSHLSKTQFEIAMAISENVSCSVDKKTNVITITAEAQDPLISATIADSTKALLQTFITKYRTTKAINDLRFMEKLFVEAHDNYVKARQKYSAFCDANMDAILESVRSKQEDLENDMQLQYNIYTQVAQQLQMARAKVQERTPAFTVIQSATVPVKHSNTPKVVYLFAFAMLGFVARSVILIRKNKNVLVLK